MEFVFTISSDEAGIRVDVFLAHHAGLSRSRVKKLINDGCAVSGDGSPLKPSYHVETSDVIYLTVPHVKEPEFLPENIPLDIVFQDEHIIVVNKPAGMVVHPGRGNVTGTLASALLYRCGTLSQVGGAMRPGIVHRLDKDTSGLIITALNDDVHRILSSMFQNREVKKVYTAFVWGHPCPESGTVDAPVGRNPGKPTLRAVIEDGKPSVTHYETIARFNFISKLSVKLETGRTHQIRVHMAHIGHPVFGDPSYSGREEILKGFNPDIRIYAKRLLMGLKRQALHAGHIEFKHPVTGEEMNFDIPLPDDLVWFEKALTGL